MDPTICRQGSRDADDEIRLLEHCYIFEEFRPMYHSVCAHSKFVDEWFQRKAGKHKLPEYLELIEK